MKFNNSELIDTDDLDTRLAQGEESIPLFRSILGSIRQTLNDRFTEETPVEQLVHARAWAVDQVLQRIWQKYFAEHAADTALIAVGGYGRGELHPGSDVDILILNNHINTTELRSKLEKFTASLWDTGLEIGHSVRSLDECITAAAEDIPSRATAGC